MEIGEYFNIRMAFIVVDHFCQNQPDFFQTKVHVSRNLTKVIADGLETKHVTG